jgi:hypothetical protein
MNSLRGMFSKKPVAPPAPAAVTGTVAAPSVTDAVSPESVTVEMTGATPSTVPVSDNFKNNIANRVTIDIYGKNDPAYGGDVLFIAMSSPADFNGDIPADSTPLNKSNYNILNAFINEKLSPDFKNAFNKDITSGTKGILQMGSQTTFGMAKSEIQKKLFDTSITPELRNAIKAFSAQLNNLPAIDNADVSSWRLPDCSVNYDDSNGNWNTKTVGEVYHIIIGKKSLVESNVIDIATIRNEVNENLTKFKGLIGAANNAQRGQASSIDNLITKLDTIAEKQLKNLHTNLKGMFVADAKNPDASKQSNTKIANNTYRNLWYDAINQLFFKKQMSVTQGKYVSGTNPLTGTELINILTTGFLMQGGKTKKHNNFHKRRNNRKTSKK